MPEEQNGREGLPRGLPVGRDAACVWHCLDGVLQPLYGIRDALEEGGFKERAEELQTVVDALELARKEAEEKLAKVT